MERVIADARTLGVHHLRTGVSWADWHTPEGDAWYEWLIPRLASEFDLLPCFHYTPPSLGIEPRTSSPPREPKRFADFIDVMITRFGDHFDHVELWNEPNNPVEWDWTLDADWVRFGETVGGAAHWARKRGKRVVLGGMSPLDPHWLNVIFERGIMDHVDVVGVHGFPGTWEPNWSGWSRHVGRVRDVLDAHGSDARIWITETGYSTWNLDERDQVRRFLDLLDAPADRAYWYGVDDLDPARPAQVGFHVDEREYHFGLRDARGRAKLLHRLWSSGGVDAVRDAAWLTTPAFGDAGGVASGPDSDERPVLITGGAGFVGVNLAHRFLSAGRPVVLLDNLSRPTALRNLEWLRREHDGLARVEVADVRRADVVRASVDRASAVFHLAAQVAVTTSLHDPLHDFEVNARGTLNVLEAARASDDPPPIVLTSTNKVYGHMPDVEVERRGMRYEPRNESILRHGVSEERALDFHSPYGCSKGAADQYVVDYARTFGIPATVFRMSCVYGPHQYGTEDQGWVAHFLLQARRREPITIFGDGCQVRDVLSVDDLVDAFILAEERIDRLQGRAFNVGGGPQNTLSLLELIESIEALEGETPHVEYAEWRTGDQPYYVSDVRALAAETGWRPRVGVREGLRRLHAWLDESTGRRAAAEPPKAR